MIILIFSMLVAGKVSALDKVLHCGHLVDVVNLQVHKKMSIKVSGDRITKIEKGFSRQKKGRAVDLSQSTCLPGFIDLHVHFEQDFPHSRALSHPEEAQELMRALDFPKQTLYAGFTTVRDMASLRNVTATLKRAIEKGKIEGPEIINAGVPISSTNGHIDVRPKIPQPRVRPSSRQQIQDYYQYRYVDRLEDVVPWFQHFYGDRVDWYRSFSSQSRKDIKELTFDAIKIAATGGVVSKNPDSHGPQLSQKIVEAVVENAKKYGKKVGKILTVASHAHGLDGIAHSVFGGVDTIEHGTGLFEDLEMVKSSAEKRRRQILRQKVVQKMKTDQIYFIPTLVAGKAVLKYWKAGQLPDHIGKKAQRVEKFVVSNFRQVVESGVPIAFGSDTGISKHGENAREFIEMVQSSSLTPLQALQIGTINAAKAVKRDKLIGSLEVGKQADIVAIAGRPDLDIKKVMDVNFVMRKGQVFKKLGK